MDACVKPSSDDFCSMRGQAHRLRQSAVYLWRSGGGLVTPPFTGASFLHLYVLITVRAIFHIRINVELKPYPVKQAILPI